MLLWFTYNRNSRFNNWRGICKEEEQVPVLIAKSGDGYDFVRGEQRIIDYLQQACFSQNPLLYLGKPVSEEENIDVFTQEQGECSVQLDCNPQ